jgi:hypothetical protein
MERTNTELLKLQLRGYVINRGTKSDQELANHYYYFCDRQNFTFVQIKPGRKGAWINVELFGRVLKLDKQAKQELEALLRRPNGTDYNTIPTLADVPNQLAAQVALELLRICEALQKRAEKPPIPADAPTAAAPSAIDVNVSTESKSEPEGTE